ncbi:unnamed protein product [Orchesella dallaii]|uniref:Uncharacterized protein n=1 Tax=Orchesella dallaii TaxID=48710 RepID=A0ABP1QQ35_9HEXA
MSAEENLRKFVFVVLLFVSFITIAEAYRPQQLILYSEDNFTGRQKSFYTSTFELDHDSIGKIAKSHCIVRGLWKISGTFYSNPNLTFVENAYGADKDNTGVSGRVCGTWHSKNRTAQYKSIEFIGANDLDTPALNLNTKPRFLGADLYFDGNFLRLPASLSFHSYGFTGKENWTLYANTNFSGASECLEAAVDKHGYAVTFNVNKTFVVGSIWRGGCGPTTAHSRGVPEGGGGKKKPDGKGSQGHVLAEFTNLLITFISALLLPSFAIRA